MQDFPPCTAFALVHRRASRRTSPLRADAGSLIVTLRKRVPGVFRSLLHGYARKHVPPVEVALLAAAQLRPRATSSASPSPSASIDASDRRVLCLPQVTLAAQGCRAHVVLQLLRLRNGPVVPGEDLLQRLGALPRALRRRCCRAPARGASIVMEIPPTFIFTTLPGAAAATSARAVARTSAFAAI